jgi:small-conductance mechanosensitive channel
VINEAQEIALEVLANHPAILRDPEPSVLAESLEKSTVNLRVYFWLNGREHSWLKVRSSVLPLVKRAFQENGISMPDEAREVMFPQGIPVTMLDVKQEATQEVRAASRSQVRPANKEVHTASTKAEGRLESEASVIKEQARQLQPLNQEENLLAIPPASSSRDKTKKMPGNAGDGPKR